MEGGLIMNFINIIILILWFIVVTLFLREIVNPKSEKINTNPIIYSTDKRSYIVQKYIIYFSILLFVTVVKLFFI